MMAKSAKRLKTGILIIAVGNQNYGMYAGNLIMSIRHTDKDVPIAVAHDGVALERMNPRLRQMINVEITMPESYYTTNGIPDYVKSKLFLDKLTPFDNTLYLDSDMLWFPRRNVSGLISQLEKLDFTIQNRGVIDLKQKNIPAQSTFWCDLNKLKSERGYKSGKYFNLSSELIWFKTTDENTDFFKSARDIHRKGDFSHNAFAGGVADELILAIAMIESKHKPHRIGWKPIYWAQEDQFVSNPEELYLNWWAFSMGGNVNNRQTKKTYDNLVQYYSNHIGIQYPYFAKDKRTFADGRHHI